MLMMGWFKRIKLVLPIVSIPYSCALVTIDLVTLSFLEFSLSAGRNGTLSYLIFHSRYYQQVIVFFKQMQNRMQSAQDAQGTLRKQLDGLKREIKTEQEARPESVSQSFDPLNCG